MSIQGCVGPWHLSCLQHALHWVWIWGGKWQEDPYSPKTGKERGSTRSNKTKRKKKKAKIKNSWNQKRVAGLPEGDLLPSGVSYS